MTIMLLALFKNIGYPHGRHDSILLIKNIIYAYRHPCFHRISLKNIKTTHEKIATQRFFAPPRVKKKISVGGADTKVKHNAVVISPRYNAATTKNKAKKIVKNVRIKFNVFISFAYCLTLQM